MTDPNEIEPTALIAVHTKLGKCCGTFCDKAAILEMLEKELYCVLCWTLADGIYSTEGPYTREVAYRRARQLAQLQYITHGYDSRQENGDFIFVDDEGVDILKITVSQLIPYGVVT